MLIGNKKDFAIELTCNEFFDKACIASGCFIIYIDGFSYGSEKYDTITFSIICAEVHKIFELSKIQPEKAIYLENKLIADLYYDMYFRENRIFSELELQDFSLLVHNNLVYEWSMDAALDEGNMIIQVNKGNIITLIGFTTENEKIKDLHTISLNTAQFQYIINTVLYEIQQMKENIK